MRRAVSIALLGAALAVAGGTARAQSPSPGGPETVVVPSGALALHGLRWRPPGPGPFPAVLFNHGSGHAPGTAGARLDHRHPELMGPLFARHGYELLYLFRRGDGLSGGQGVPSADLMDRE